MKKLPSKPSLALAPQTKREMIVSRQMLAPASEQLSFATEKIRSRTAARKSVVLYVDGLVSKGLSQRKAVEQLRSSYQYGLLEPELMRALCAAAVAGRGCPSKTVISEWRKTLKTAHSEESAAALMPKWRGKVNAPAPWMAQAAVIYNAPSKPAAAAVHRELTEVHGYTCTYDMVLSYLRALPAQYGEQSAARMGSNLHRLKLKPYKPRTTENMLAGDVYAADGYRADVLIAHPITGDIWRPELTVGMDVRSRFIVGWRADEHEGTVAVQNMWAEAFTRHRHVPLDLYIDNGSGHKNKLMSTDGTGFYDRAGVCVTHAHPGNPHGKGWIERFFRIMKEDFLKLWQPEFYFGGDMAPEIKNKITREVRAGHRKLPSAAQFADAFNAWLARYHSRPHPEMPGRSIASVWAELEPVSPALDEISLKRQVIEISVVRGMLNHGKRKYRAPELLAYTGKKLLLEYDLLDDQVAIVCTLDGRFICDAALVSAIDVFAPNRQEEKRQQRAQGQAKRTALRADVQRARAGLLIDAEAVATGTQELLDVPTRLISSGAEDDFDIDITELLPNSNPSPQSPPTQGDLDD